MPSVSALQEAYHEQRGTSWHFSRLVMSIELGRLRAYIDKDSKMSFNKEIIYYLAQRPPWPSAHAPILTFSWTPAYTKGPRATWNA